MPLCLSEHRLRSKLRINNSATLRLFDGDWLLERVLGQCMNIHNLHIEIHMFIN